MRGSVRRRGRTWTYVVDVGRDPATGRRRQRSKGGFATRREAEKALGRALVAIGAGELAGAGGLTLGAYLERWLAGVQPSLKPSTAKSYRELVEWYVRPRVGRVRLDDLNALHLSNLYADLLTNGAMRSEGVECRPRRCGECTRCCARRATTRCCGGHSRATRCSASSLLVPSGARPHLESELPEAIVLERSG
jgi:hypothetical protein